MKMKKKITISLIILAVIVAGIAIYFAQKPNEPETIKIGAILPLTGAAAGPGQSLLNGLKVSQLKKFNLIIEDSKNSPKDGISAFNKLINVDKIDVLITAMSSVSLALLPLAESKEIPVFITLSNYPDISSKYKWSFRFFINSVREGQLLAEFLLAINKRKIGILNINDEGGLGTATSLLKSFTEKGGAVIYTESFDVNKQDFRDLVTKVKTWKVDALGVIGYGKALGTLVSQLREGGVKVALVSTTPMGANDAQSSAGDAVFTELYYISPLFPFSKDSSAQLFRELYRKEYGIDPDFIAAYGFDLGNLIAQNLLASSNSNKFNHREFIASIYQYTGRGANGQISVSKKNREINAEIVVVRKYPSEVKIIYPKGGYEKGTKNE
jgi:branched-chain amino acid transport system substrate-binding protein